MVVVVVCKYDSTFSSLFHMHLAFNIYRRLIVSPWRLCHQEIQNGLLMQLSELNVKRNHDICADLDVTRSQNKQTEGRQVDQNLTRILCVKSRIGTDRTSVWWSLGVTATKG